VQTLRTRLHWFTVPKNLLLFDFVGALVTSLSTGLLLTTILPTGLPVWILFALSITAAGFACVDVVAYCYWPNQCWPVTVVGLLNLSYCVAVIAALLVFRPQISSIGTIYFAIECTIVIPLAVFELMVARYCRLRSRTNNPTDRGKGSAAS
jgi:hypothetical protein